MSFFAFSRLLRSRWRRLARVFWPATHQEQLQAELERLDSELARHHQRLLKFRQKIEKLRIGLQRREQCMALLACEAVNEADTRAVEELAYRGQAIDRLRKRLRAREQAYEELLVRFRRRKQQRAAVREQLLCCPSPHPTGSEDESDSDYPF
jgi:hypothetical protein